MTCPWSRIVIVLMVALTDVFVYVYDVYVKGRSASQSPISYPAHISGAATGLLVGIMCLKNLHWETYEKYIWAVSSLTFALLMLTAIVWNLAVPSHFTGAPIFVNCTTDRVL